MNRGIDPASSIEACARALLGESVTRIGAGTRSRLNRARRAALAASLQPRRSLWRSSVMMPFTGAVAAAVVAAVLLVRGSGSHPQVSVGNQQPSLEVIDLLTSGESMSLMENYDHGFYEWAAVQAETSAGQTSSAAKPAS